ncbi:MAG TPA: ATP-dependent zinc metalloprotease FtsH [Candidatus Methylomirabilis sp.]|nr:ATP-dependent zinc metalloprotease FtsH [Candidatus Methylomirabilis sp.]
MRKDHKFNLSALLIGFAVLMLLQVFLQTEHVLQMPYSDFKKALKDGKVAEVTLSGDLIRGQLREQDAQGKATQRSFVAVRVPDTDLVRDLEAQNVKFTGTIQNTWLRDLFFMWVLPIGLLWLVSRVMFKKLGPGSGMLSFGGLGRNKAKIYAQSEIGVTFNDVAGVDEAKEELKEVVEFLKSPKKFQNLGGRIPKGVLLVGPPGTGKTLLAKAVAGESGVPFFSVSGSEFVEMFVGLGAARVRDLFTQAQEKAPCIIFMDELDALGKARGANPLGGHDEREQTLNQLLVEMDGFDAKKGVIIMAATNRPEILDPALLRPGRFDRQVLVDRPDINGREAILRVHAKGVKLAPDVDLKVLAARTAGFVGADLANLLNEAALLAARNNKTAVEMADLEEAIDRVVAGLEKKARVMSPKERERVAYHEAGHALVASAVPTADPVHKISIIPRGIAALGYTLQLPTEDRYLLTRSELLDRVAVLLGGRGAEALTFGEVSTGAQNDLQRAADIARRMVKEYGMSERLGAVAFEPERRPMFLPGGNGLSGGAPYSETTAREIDEEVKRIVDETERRVQDLLTQRKSQLQAVAQRLLQKEVLDGEELRALLDGQQTGEGKA